MCRPNPVCASCHNYVDPLGFGLENYDLVGRWRTTDQGLPIDAKGKLPTGETFEGARELSQIIGKDPRRRGESGRGPALVRDHTGILE